MRAFVHVDILLIFAIIKFLMQLIYIGLYYFSSREFDWRSGNIAQPLRSGVLLSVCAACRLKPPSPHCTFEDMKISDTKGHLHRIEQQLSIQHIPPLKKYAQMHGALAAMDEPQTVSYLQVEYSRLILWSENKS